MCIGHTRSNLKFDDGDEDRQLSEAELSQGVSLQLTETNTMWLLDMPSICVMGDSDEALEIVRQKARHREQVHLTRLFLSTVEC